MNGTTLVGMVVVCLTFAQQLFAYDSCELRWKKLLDTQQIIPAYESLKHSCENSFRDQLFDIIKDNDFHSYKDARIELFGKVFQEEGNTIRCVYTDKTIKSNKIPSNNQMNTEHIWPQSLGAKGIAKSDLHHLAPTLPDVNSSRGNLPFCEVKKLSKISEQLCPPNTCKHGYSEKGTLCFEPPTNFKGDVARSLFYFSVRYVKGIDQDQETILRKWHVLDPVSCVEKDRNDLIYLYQHNRNPFIDHPEFINMIENL